MKTNFNPIIAILCSAVILLALTACNAVPTIPADSAPSQEELNKAVVTQYFHEVLDGEQYDKMPYLFTPAVVMHRPEGTLNTLYIIQPAFKAALSPHTMETTIHEMIASGDYVAVRLSHKMKFSTEQASLRSRLGDFDVRGKTVEWDAMVMLRFKDGKIAEEWVSADELGKLMQIGTLELSVKGE